MLKYLAEIAPTALTVSVIGWGAAHYFVIGPEIAARIVRADHLLQCERGYQELALKAGEERAASIPLPKVDAAQQFAADQARRMLNSPFMHDLRGMSGGLGGYLGFDGAVEQTLALVDQQKRAAREAYERSLAMAKQETAANLARSGDICGCIGDLAIAETRADWAVLSGTIGLYRTASLAGFDQKMAQVQSSGRCTAAKAGA